MKFFLDKIVKFFKRNTLHENDLHTRTVLLSDGGFQSSDTQETCLAHLRECGQSLFDKLVIAEFLHVEPSRRFRNFNIYIGA